MAVRVEVGERLSRLPRDAGRDPERLAGGRAGEADRELGEDADVGAAEAVDRLLAIADDEETARAHRGEAGHDARRRPRVGPRPKKLEEIALDPRRVLELVDEERLDPTRDLGGHVGPVAQELARGAEDLAEAEHGARLSDLRDLDLALGEHVADEARAPAKACRARWRAARRRPFSAFGAPGELVPKDEEVFELGRHLPARAEARELRSAVLRCARRLASPQPWSSSLAASTTFGCVAMNRACVSSRAPSRARPRPRPCLDVIDREIARRTAIFFELHEDPACSA